jgi:hypothetical protein
MKNRWQKISAAFVIFLFVLFASVIFSPFSKFAEKIIAQTSLTPTPTPANIAFDQAAALAKLREQIKGKENEPAEKVFKNIQTLKGVPASRLLAIMNFGYARSLGVDCTHCHTPDKWEAEDKTQKQTARDMKLMADKINDELLKNIKNIGAEPTINCTTCHRGEVKPALNLPTAKN